MDPGNHQTPMPTTGQLVTIAGVFYLLMGALGLWLVDAQDLDVTLVVWGDGENVLTDTALGAGVGLFIVALSYAARNWGPLKDLSAELGRELGTPGSGAIAFLAFASSVGEELLFRGALQQWAGFWPTVFIFGLLHGGFTKRLRVWAIFATLAGAVLGGLTLLTNNLLAPILCHLTVNYFNLHLLVDENRPKPPPRDPSGGEEPPTEPDGQG